MSDYGSTPVYNSGVSGKIIISRKDKDILRRLAGIVAELADRPVEKEKRKLWLSHNSLKPVRPLVFCDPENGWNEIITKDQIECNGELAQRWEMVLRKEIFWGESMLDDKVIEPYFDVGYTYIESNWGFNPIMHGGNDGGSYVWESPIKKYSDIDKVHFPVINIDYKATQKTLEVASDTFGDLIKVRKTGVWWWSLGMTLTLALLRGLTNIMMDMIDNPKLIHRLMKILSEGTLKRLDFLEENGLLSLNTDRYVGSGGFGYTEELPAKGFNDSKVRTTDMWGFCESQETVGVSPQMFEEFVFPYQLPILERFGLNCYGCCEPLDLRWHIIKNIPNLRRVSVSSWANFAQMAEYLQDNYVYSLKMKPTDIAVPKIDEDVVRKRIRDVLNIAKGCIIEIIMKDNHTIGKNPNNVIRWTQIAREEAEIIS
ncbi:MAG: uroporphyrinogen decarboxylase/cobalamine-independent methonine synthase family protein [Candidatus Humimicrobiaceae bacterium]